MTPEEIQLTITQMLAIQRQIQESQLRNDDQIRQLSDRQANSDRRLDVLTENQIIMTESVINMSNSILELRTGIMELRAGQQQQQTVLDYLLRKEQENSNR
jgi:hypothetical protein